MLENARKKMDKCIDLLILDFSKIIANRITAIVFDNLNIKCNDISCKINQLAVISKDSINSLLLKPFDKKNINLLYDAICSSNLHLSPVIVKDYIKVVFPKMTVERRSMLVKNVKILEENTKVAIRNIRRDFNKQLKIDLKNSVLSIDDEKKNLKKIQDLTDEYIKKIVVETKNKEKDLMQI